MSERKNTPDILADLLTGAAPQAEMDFAAPPPAARRSAPRQAPAQKAAAPAPKAQRQATAQAYELQIVSFQEHNGWRMRFIDGREVKNWTTSPTLAEYAACMSADGWRIAAAVHGPAMWGHYDKYQIYFQKAAS
jgi:hypothetical protein